MRFAPLSQSGIDPRAGHPAMTTSGPQGLQGPPDHSCCDPAVCKAMSVRFGAVHEKGQEGRGVKRELSPGSALKGVAIIEASVSKDARGYGNRTGFGVRWMVDQQLNCPHMRRRHMFSWPWTTAFEKRAHHPREHL
jgi:hypothetical protein